MVKIFNMNELDKIKEEVEQRLQQQQANKEFKDVGRVAQTKKERSAYKIISSKLLREIELDPVMAFNMIKKDNVWVKIDIENLREKGNTSGAVYLKVKIRESVPTKPKDDKLFRSIYVLFLERLQKDLDNCFNVDEILALTDEYRNLKIDEIIGEFMFPEYKDGSNELKSQIKETLSKNSNWRMAILYGSGTFFRKLIKEVFKAKFENMLFIASDSAIKIRNEAREKEPISKADSESIIENLTTRHESFLNANKKKISNYESMNARELKNEMNSNWRISSFSKEIYNSDIEKFREFVINYTQNSVSKQTELFAKRIENAKPRPNNWDWVDVKDNKTESKTIKPKKEPINTKPPLSYIKRTGGVKIDIVTPKEIVDKFGFSAVNYGNYVDDVWSKEHTSHFLGAISDLGEMLNIDVKQVNQLGSLSIAFGSKGRAGHLATYFPQTKDINLTKKNGDGSVAHEWGHYFDNVIVEEDLKRATNSFASQGLMPNAEIKGLYKELMDFIYRGKEGITPKLKFRFYPNNSDYASFSKYENNSWVNVNVEIKPTIEETIKQYDYLFVAEDKYYSTQIRVLGYIIKSFNLDYYDVDIKLKTSYFFHKSAYSSYIYCFKDKNGRYVKAGEKRTKYWYENVELFARAWETVVLKKLMDKGRESNYLVADIPTTDIVSADYFKPYPSGKELEHIENILDRIIIAVKSYYSIGDFVPTSNVKEDVFIELSENKKKGENKIGVKVEKTKKEKDVLFVKEDVVVEVIEQPKEDNIQDLIDALEILEENELVEALKLLI